MFCFHGNTAGHIDPTTMMSHLIDATEQHTISAQFDLREEVNPVITT